MPEVYGFLTGDPFSEKLYRNRLISVLEGALENCVILHDKDGMALGALTAAIQEWPQAQKTRAMKILKQLSQSHRLIAVSAPPTNTPIECPHPLCFPILTLSQSAVVEMILVMDNCSLCNKDNRSVGLSDYVLSDFEHSRKRAIQVHLHADEWKIELFEKRVWRPIFRFAKHIQIFDRNIGGMIRKRSPYVIPSNYERTLQWLFQQIVLCSRSPVKPDVEIYTVTPNWCGVESMLILVALDNWAMEMQRLHGISIRFVLKQARDGLLPEHDRFLVTDQIAISIGRGFDLIDHKGDLRDVVVNHVLERGKPKAAYDRLPGL